MKLKVRIGKPSGIQVKINQPARMSVHMGNVKIISEGYRPPQYEGEYEVIPTKETQALETNGYLLKNDITVQPIPDEYVIPEGTKNIVTNGEHDVKDFEKVDVDVPIPDGYVKPQGVKEIVTNGDHDVTEVKTARVNVPNKIPDGYIKPSGTKQITQNGTHDVKQYESAEVNVPIPEGYIKPQGTKQITQNGEHDVNSYQKVNVDVPNEIPEGYYDASGLDVDESKVLEGEIYIDENGHKIGTMPNKGAVNATIQGLVSGMSTPQPYTIPEGYHNGKGKVQISSDVKTLHDDIAKALRNKGQVVSVNYDPKQFPSQIGNIQTSEDLDSVLTEQEELIAELQETLKNKASGGGGEIPEGYYDASGITTSTSDVRKGKEFINKDGKQVGTMPEYLDGVADRTLSVDYYPDSFDSLFYMIPKGYHDGNSYVDIDPRSKSVTPTKQAQKVTPDSKTVLYEVNVAPIPDEYIIPQGEKEITENGQYDVSSFASVKVNVAGGGGGEPDPSALYQRVEYIESAEEGTYPYIVTDFCADNDSGVEVVASFPILQDRIPMGSREDSNATRFYCCYPLSSTGSYYGFNSGSTLSGSFAVNTKYICQTNFLCSRMAGIFTPNGDRKSSGIITTTLTTQSGPVSIFGYRYCSTGNMASKREYKFYGARLSQLFEVVREYIPCYRKSDGVVGVYEKFTGQFLTNNADTGSFAKGADIDW